MLHEYMVIGRKTPTERDPEPTVYKMRLFASDAPKARSRFWVSTSPLSSLFAANRTLAVFSVEAAPCEEGER